MRKWRFLLSRFTEQLWVRAALYAVFGIAAALLAAVFSYLIPDWLAEPFGGGTVTDLLKILASSLLAVATFSVMALLTAFTNVSQGATPRAATLVAGNRSAQGALATFVGAFLYAVVGFSALGTGYYDDGGRTILFFLTLVMLAIVAVTLLRWLDHLLHLARIENAITAVEDETSEAIQSVFGAQGPRSLCKEIAGGQSIEAGRVGYVQNVDIGALRELAVEHALEVWIQATPGSFTVSDTVLARVAGVLDPAVKPKVRQAFTLGAIRSFSQDPRFGFIVLSEIGAKALSPGVNNPGMAKDVITSIVRLLERWMMLRNKAPRASTGPVHWTGSTLEELLEDALLSISSDGATSVTVAVRLQNVLSALQPAASDEDRQAIIRFAHEALERSEAGLSHEPDKARVRRATAGGIGAA
jgi:uncharacterized membrane protein